MADIPFLRCPAALKRRVPNGKILLKLNKMGQFGGFCGCFSAFFPWSLSLFTVWFRSSTTIITYELLIVTNVHPSHPPHSCLWRVLTWPSPPHTSNKKINCQSAAMFTEMLPHGTLQRFPAAYHPLGRVHVEGEHWLRVGGGWVEALLDSKSPWVFIVKRSSLWAN